SFKGIGSLKGIGEDEPLSGPISGFAPHAFCLLADSKGAKHQRATVPRFQRRLWPAPTALLWRIRSGACDVGAAARSVALRVCVRGGPLRARALPALLIPGGGPEGGQSPPPG